MKGRISRRQRVLSVQANDNEGRYPCVHKWKKLDVSVVVKKEAGHRIAGLRCGWNPMNTSKRGRRVMSTSYWKREELKENY